MSMLVRKGTMLHARTRSGKRRGSISSQRNKAAGEAAAAAVAAAGGSSSPGPPDHRDTTTGHHNNSARNSVTDSTASPLKTLDSRKGNHDGSHLNKPTANRGHHNHNPEDGDISRRTSSCTSQISSDDRRQLYRYSKFAESRDYGSFLSQIREANTESNSGWEFTNKFFTILCKSAFASVFFMCLIMLALAMAFMGIKYLDECPVQPNLPRYFLVGGFCALVELIWVIYGQFQSRKYEHCDASFFEEDIILGSNTLKMMQWILSGFLLICFAWGNSLMFNLSRYELPDGSKGPPPFVPSLQAPQKWCSEQLYLFSISHLYIVYGLGIISLIFWIACFSISTIKNYQRDK